MRIDNIIQEPVSAKDFHLAVPVGLALPESVDLRQYAGDIEQQGQLGSCVANATVSALEMMLQRAGRFAHQSRLFVYYNARQGQPGLEGKDKGSYLSDGFKSCWKYGVPEETVWPYIESKVNVKPSDTAYALASATKVTKYQRVGQFNVPGSVERIKTALAMGYPVTISMYITDALYSMSGKLGDDSCLYRGGGKRVGGHAMNIVGYTPKGFIVENSWGNDWGDVGFALLTDAIVQKDLMDAWTATSFAGIDQQPDFSWTPTDPVVADVTGYPGVIQFKQRTADTLMFGYLMQGTATGGEGPYTYEWTTSDPAVTLSEGQFSAPSIDVSGWFQDELRSVTVTCIVSDSQIPAQQSTASALLMFCNGVDINSPYGQAFRLYRACFGRTPDQEGLIYWTNEIANGMELRDVAARFIDSKEYRDLYGNVSDKEFVTLLYIHVLNREPDADGHAYWLGRIHDGYPTQDVLVSFSESPENKERARW